MTICVDLISTIKHLILRIFKKFKMEQKLNFVIYILLVGLYYQKNNFHSLAQKITTKRQKKSKYTIQSMKKSLHFWQPYPCKNPQKIPNDQLKSLLGHYNVFETFIESK